MNGLYFSRTRLLLIFLQAPLLAILLFIVARYTGYTITPNIKNTLIVYIFLSCSAIYLGFFNSIREISKERHALLTENAASIKCATYILSKLIIMTIVSFIQTTLLLIFFAVLVGLPDRGIIFVPYFEILITTFLTASAASTLGLFVSTLFNNMGRVLAVFLGLLLFLPQLFLAGAAFVPKCKSLRPISYATISRCSVEAFGATAGVLEAARQEGYETGRKLAEEYVISLLGNYLDSNPLGEKLAEILLNTEEAQKLLQERVDIEFEKTMKEYGINFESTPKNLAKMWAVLFGYVICFSLAAFFVLRKISNVKTKVRQV